MQMTAFFAGKLSSKNCCQNSPLLSCSLQLLHHFVSVISPTSHRNLIDSMKSRQIEGEEEDGGGRPHHEDKVPPKDAAAMMSVDRVGDSGDAGCREGVCIPFEKQSKKYTDNQPASWGGGVRHWQWRGSREAAGSGRAQ
jgi:hypothetical protein